MWRLSFRDGGVVIISASSLIHARLLAAANGLGRASRFVEGNFLDIERHRSSSAECFRPSRHGSWMRYSIVNREIPAPSAGGGSQRLRVRD